MYRFTLQKQMFPIAISNYQMTNNACRCYILGRRFMQAACVFRYNPPPVLFRGLPLLVSVRRSRKDQWGYPLVNSHIAMENYYFNGTIHYFYVVKPCEHNWLVVWNMT